MESKKIAPCSLQGANIIGCCIRCLFLMSLTMGPY
jgi:hypothetical protein